MNLTHKNEHCMTREQKEDNFLLEGAIENCTGVDYVNRKGTKIEILPFDAPKKVHSVVAGQGAGMSFFKQSEVLTKLTTVLESYDEVAIIEAIEKNHFLDLKKLSDIDLEKSVLFFMKNVKDKVVTTDPPQIIFDGHYDYFMRKCRSLGMSCFLSAVNTDDFITASKAHSKKSKKQPDYRKFEKKNRF